MGFFKPVWSFDFRALSALLPSLDGPRHSRFDLSGCISATVSGMMSRSPLLPKAFELLRNDSVEEMAHQTALYDGILDLIQRMGHHHGTFPSSSGNVRRMGWRTSFSASHSILDVSARMRLCIAEKGRSIMSLLARLAAQSYHYIAVWSRHLQSLEEDSKEQVVLSVSRSHLANSSEARGNMPGSGVGDLGG